MLARAPGSPSSVGNRASWVRVFVATARGPSRRAATATCGSTTGSSGRRLRVIQANDQGEETYSPSVGPSGNVVVAANWDDARAWNARTGRLIRTLHGHDFGAVEIAVQTIELSPDGTLVVTAGADGTARVWDTGNWSQLAVLQGHSGTVFVAHFSPDGSRVVTVGVTAPHGFGIRSRAERLRSCGLPACRSRGPHSEGRQSHRDRDRRRSARVGSVGHRTRP